MRIAIFMRWTVTCVVAALLAVTLRSITENKIYQPICTGDICIITDDVLGVLKTSVFQTRKEAPPPPTSVSFVCRGHHCCPTVLPERVSCIHISEFPQSSEICLLAHNNPTALVLLIAQQQQLQTHCPRILTVQSQADVERLSWIFSFDASALQRWDVRRVTVAVITQHRVADLARLITSLLAADYLGDTVDLRITIDTSPGNIEGHRAVTSYMEALHWPHGGKTLHHRVVRAGLVPAVLESWYPADDNEVGVLLEDDVSVSRQWYAWLKLALLQYDATDSSLIGISLYTPRIIELDPARPPLDLSVRCHNCTAALLQTPCSWGGAYFAWPWRLLHNYATHRMTLSPDQGHALDIIGAASNTWSTSWKRFLIELMYARGWVMLYPSLANETSFSTNHLSPGEHVASSSTIKHRILDYVVPLWHDSFPPAMHSLPALDALPVFNMFGQRRPSVSSLRGASVAWPSRSPDPAVQQVIDALREGME